MQKYEVPQFFTCLEFAPNGDVITGDSSGGIIVWSKGNYPLSVPVDYEMWLGHFWSKFTEFSYFFFVSVSKKIKFTVRNAHEVLEN